MFRTIILAMAILVATPAFAGDVSNQSVNLFGNGTPLSVTKADRKANPNMTDIQIKRMKARELFRDGTHIPSDAWIDMAIHLGSKNEMYWVRRYVVIENYKNAVNARLQRLTKIALEQEGIPSQDQIAPDLKGKVAASNHWRLLWYYNIYSQGSMDDLALVRKVSKDSRVPIFVAVMANDKGKGAPYFIPQQVPIRSYRDTWQSNTYNLAGTPTWIFEDDQHNKVYKIFGAGRDATVEAYIAALSGKE